MSVVRETQLPGVGVKHDFIAEDGREIGVLTHKDGRRDIVVYGAHGPDSCAVQLTVSANDTRTLGEMLGTSQVRTAVDAVQQEVEGLNIEWLPIAADSPAVDKTIAEGAYRTRTGASIVAIIRADTPIPAPEPDVAILAGDVVVAVGTADKLATLADLVSPG